MDGKEVGIFFLKILLLAQFISLLISLVPYFLLMGEMRADPSNTEHLIGLGYWIKDFVVAQVYGWPLSMVINGLYELLNISKYKW